MTTKRRLVQATVFTVTFAFTMWAMTYVIDLAYDLYFIFTH